jgi:hypothetical protein
MARAKIGTGKLEPFKKGSAGSETTESSKTKNGPTRSGFFDNLMTTRAGGPQTVESEDPKVGLGGWRQKQRYESDTAIGNVPAFHERSNGIRTFPAFSKKRVEGD